eukprot:7292247-Lingulodinium_polyedra.AAC.1
MLESRLFCKVCLWSCFDPKDLAPLDAARVLAWQRAEGWCNVKGKGHVHDAAVWHAVGERAA